MSLYAQPASGFNMFNSYQSCPVEEEVVRHIVQKSGVALSCLSIVQQISYCDTVTDICRPPIESETWKIYPECYKVEHKHTKRNKEMYS
jgi:hypothetical protein